MFRPSLIGPTVETSAQAQAQLIAAACSSVAAVYGTPPTDPPGLFLEHVARALWKFALARRLGRAGPGVWAALGLAPSGGEPEVLGPSFSGSLSLKRRRQRHARVESLALARLTGGGGGDNHVAPARDHLELWLDDGDGGRALLLAGTLTLSTQARHAFATDPLIGAVFAALARAARDRVVRPSAHRRDLMLRLPPSPRMILPLVLDGLTTPEIADLTRRSPHTVHDHVQVIFKRFGVGSRRELMALWNSTLAAGSGPGHEPDGAAPLAVSWPAQLAEIKAINSERTATAARPADRRRAGG